MKIKLYGTGALVTKKFGACAMIDDIILFDCPNGLVRKLRQDNVDFEKIKLIIISHFHGDHDYDLPFLLWEYNRVKRQTPLTIIAPKGFEERHKILCDMLFPDTLLPGESFYEKIIKNVKINIIETEGGKVFQFDGYKIIVYKVEHGNCDAYGYRIEKDGKAAGFTGDARMSENINNLVKDCKIAFIDVTGLPPANAEPVHFDMQTFKDLSNAHKNVRFVPTHMSGVSFAELKEKGYSPPNDDDVIEI